MDDQDWKDIFNFKLAEQKAFDASGLKVGAVYFECPICGGEAVGNRYKYRGRIHGLGSGCKDCGIRHS